MAHNHEHHKHAKIYVCEGGCGARLTQEEYDAHPTKVCGAEGCPNNGHAFVKKEWCQDCGDYCKECKACE